VSAAAAGIFVDSSVILDLFTDDLEWGEWSQAQLTRAAQRGALVINAVVLAEVAPRFERIETLRAALPSMMVIEEIPLAAAFLAGHAHATYRRGGGQREAILPDFLIGAHAAVTGRVLLTRDQRRVATYIPAVKLIAPVRPFPPAQAAPRTRAATASRQDAAERQAHGQPE
jgi:predicted nucleic acid-binding protein